MARRCLEGGLITVVTVVAVALACGPAASSEISLKELDYELPSATPEYLEALAATQSLAASLRLEGLALQAKVALFNRRIKDVKDSQRGCTTFSCLRRRRDEIGAFLTSAENAREDLKTETSQLRQRTEIFAGKLAELGGQALDVEENMSRHRSAAPALRAILAWLRSVSESTLQ